MKLTLSVTASAATLAAILSLIDQEGLDVSLAAPAADDDDQIPLPLVVPAATPPVALPVEPANIAAPAPLAALAAPQSDNGDRDSAGLPWDERIHASTKVKTSDGKWRQKRGVDKTLVAQVEAQLRAAAVAPPAPAVEQPVATVVPPVPPMPVAAVAPPPAPVEQPQPIATPVQPIAPPPAFTPPVQPVAPPPMVPPVPAPPPAPVEQPVAAPAAITFHDVMMKCQGVTPDYLTGIAQQLTAAFQLQVNSITDIASNQQLIDYTAALFQRDGNW